LEKRLTLEVEVVHVDVQTSFVSGAEVFFCILEQESCSAYATASFDADESFVPINLVHQCSSDGGLCAFHQVLMHPIKRIEHK
jgi:hypothetical protein